MKPGEYIGKDGRTYQWSYDGVRAVIVRDDDQCGWFGISLYDWPAAKAALDALIEAEQGAEQWVGLPIELFGPEVRVSLNGERWQFRNLSEAKWTDGSGIAPKGVIAYRKGREVALAENAELREQVKALVDAIQNPIHPEWRGSVGALGIAGGYLPSDEVGMYPTLEDWHRIKAAAEGVQL